MNEVCDGDFNLQNLAAYRNLRWTQSQAENSNFFFGPLSLLLYGAASFLYELMPSGPDYIPDLATISSFFGAVQADDGSWSFGEGERIPDQWYNRVSPYSNNDVTLNILAMYASAPVLFGGNTADGSFDGLGDFGSFIVDGKLQGDAVDGADTSCLLYQLATSQVPSYLNGFLTPTVDALAFITSKVGPQFENLGCPVPLTKRK